ncbi:signal peptidase I [Virgibacillus byunsanensis]|uniref:Signal peptidase I n=1 Tax=Virgibacillus byunsanensis TaxID=570945 RepID=A0ABW3LL04_9BACI
MNKNKYVRIISVILLAVVLAFVFRSFLFASYVVEGRSMEPTLYEGNLLMVNKVIYNLTDVDRFDVVIFHANAEDDYVKRVIGLPGDEIEYKNDKLYVNGKFVEESFLSMFKQGSKKPFTNDFTIEESTGSTKVPRDKLFVLGDNRIESLDSRAFGFVSTEKLVGKVDVRYWPLKEAQLSFGK